MLRRSAKAAAKKATKTKAVNVLEDIAKLAYNYFAERGYQHGCDLDDWLRAEKVIRVRKRK